MVKQKYDVADMLRRMLRMMKEEDKGQFVRIFLYTLLGGIYPFMGIFLPKIAIGILETEGENAVQPLVTAMALYFVVVGVLAVITQYLIHKIQTRNMRIRLKALAWMSKKLQTMDYRYVEDASFYEKNDRALNAGNTNNDGIEGVFNRISVLPAKLLTLAGMVILVGGLSPILLLALIVHVFMSMYVSRLSHNYQYSKKEEVARAERKIKYYNKTTHDFTFGKDIRIFNLRDRILKNYTSEIQALTVLKKKLANREYALGFLSLMTLLLSNGILYGILIYRTWQGMAISSFSMYVTAITSLMALMLEFGDDLSFILNQGQYVSDFFHLMEEPLVTEGEKEIEADSVELVFDHVTFRYPGTDVNIFKDFSFTIHKGERLAIVGVNGAGKTTLVKLMMGLYEPNEGHIYVNGTDVRELTKRSRYGLFSTVFQDFNILAFTIRENVACTSEGVNDGRVREALDRAGLGKKLQSFEKGLDQMMLKVIDENGTDFSGGERQKLAIARALYKDAPMVIMDEPTAALDALAEAEIYESFSGLVEGKTAVYISHRLASTRFCDKIALFDKDGLKEYGTHEELMERKGSYYDMFVIQGKYYTEGEAV